MADKDVEIYALIAELSDSATGDAEYPLPEEKPIKYTDVDVIIMPHGYKSEYPLPAKATDSFEMEFDLDAVKEVDSVFSIPVAVAKAMVYDYDGYKVLKPLDELEAAAVFANGIPVTREHPRSGIVTDRAEVLGFLRNPIVEDDMLKGILEIMDKDLIADIKDKKLTEVSAGFFCDLDRSDSGEWNGEHYDAIQKNIFLNHIAVTEKGRCTLEDGCGIGLDAYAYPMPPDVIDKLDAAIVRAKAIKDKSLLELLKKIRKIITAKKAGTQSKDSFMDADPLFFVKLKDAFSTLKAERDSLKAQLEGFVQVGNDSLVTELTALQDVKAVLDSTRDLKVERNYLRTQLEEIVKVEKDSLIAELTTLQDAKAESDLLKLSLDDLRKELDLVRQMKENRLAFPPSTGSKGKQLIDEAYARIGGSE